MKTKLFKPKRQWFAVGITAVLTINMLAGQSSNTPTITCPENIVVEADANCSAVVEYEITAEGGSGGEGITPTQILFASAQENKVYIADLDGTGTPQVYIDGATDRNVIGLFADYENELLYMNNGGGSAKGVYVAPLGGVTTGTQIPNSNPTANKPKFYTYVDAANDRYFFTEADVNGVYVANLDGSGSANQVALSGDIPGEIPHGLDFNPETNTLYVGAFNQSDLATGAIYAIDVVSGVSVKLFDVGGIRGLQIDAATNRIFWAQHNGDFFNGPTGEIMVANLDGTGTPEVLVAISEASPGYFYIPADVLYDPSTDTLYWSEFDTVFNSRVRSIAADGSDNGNATTVFNYVNEAEDGGYMRGLAFATEATAGGGGGEVTITQTDESGYTSGDAFPVGTTIQEYTASDGNGNTAVCSFTVTVQDIIAPVITDCPSNITQVNDSGVCEAVVTWTEPTASDNCTSSADLIWERSHVPEDIFPVGTTTVTYTATDASGNTSSICSFDIIITNAIPENVNGIIAVSDPIQAGTEFSLSADFMDDNLVSANWFFSSDGDFTNGDTAEYSREGTISGTTVIDDFVFDSTQTGVYTVKIVVEDACGETAQVVLDDNYVVVYDSSGGFVTGGGYINSPLGALVGTTAEGKANFGFVAKYRPGNNNVTLNGHTNFKFKNGNFHFKSSLYEEMSLVISGERKATYRGSGSINGEEGYDFMVTVIDGDAPGAGPMDVDSFRIKIWTSGSPNDVIYDNEIGTPENADSSTILGGGSIVIHKPRGNSNARSADISDDNSKFGNKDLFDLNSWPNPSDSYFNLSILSQNVNDKIDIQVFDVMGKTVHQDTIKLDHSYKFGHSLQAGIYTVRLTHGEYTKMIRIIKL